MPFLSRRGFLMLAGVVGVAGRRHTRNYVLSINDEVAVMARFVSLRVGSPRGDTSTAAGRAALFGDYRQWYEPSLTNTGVLPNVTRTALTGDQTITTANTVIADKDITGRVLVRAAGVRLTNCYVSGTATAPTSNTALIDCNNSACSDFKATDCTVIPQTPSIWTDAFIGHDYTAERCQTRDVVDGFGVYNTASTANNVTILGCYEGEKFYFSPDANHTDNRTHNDGLQCQGGSGLTVFGTAFHGLLSQTVGNANPAIAQGPAAATYNPYNIEVVLLKGTVGGNITNVEFGYNWFYGSAGGFVIPTLGTGDGSTFNLHHNVFEKHTVAGSQGDAFRITTSHAIPGFTSHTAGLYTDAANSNVFDDGAAATYRVAADW